MSTPTPQEMTLDAIRSVPLFSSLDDKAAAELRELLRTQDTNADTPLFSAGDAGDAMYLIESGRVRISVAKRWSGNAKYRTLGTVRIRGGSFTKRFTLSSPGTYRLRYRFQGSSTTAPGTVVEKVRIRRTVRFSTVDTADHELTYAK